MPNELIDHVLSLSAEGESFMESFSQRWVENTIQPIREWRRQRRGNIWRINKHQKINSTETHKMAASPDWATVQKTTTMFQKKRY